MTTHVALLRGINVAGRPTVPMAALKGTFGRLGLDPIRTYINSGNVLFTAPAVNAEQLTQSIEAAIAAEFGFPVGVLVRTAEEVATVADSVPEDWVHDGTMKCDVFFLWPGIDRPSVLDDVPHNPAIEDLQKNPTRTRVIASSKARTVPPPAARPGPSRRTTSPATIQLTSRTSPTWTPSPPAWAWSRPSRRPPSPPCRAGAVVPWWPSPSPS